MKKTDQSKPTAVDQETSYEALMARLVAVVDRLEHGELPLAEALALYEEGVVLEANCQRLLQSAELHIQELTSTASGNTLRPWTPPA